MKRVSMGLALILLIGPGVLRAQDDDVERIRRRYRELSPTGEDLRFYRHDWVRSLDEALRRAEQERRPIFLLAITNISGPTDFFSGHC